MAHTSSNQQDSPVYFDKDGHVHLVDPEREAFANAVFAYGERLAADYPEMSDQLAVAEEQS
jgi:hypothetical protein